MNIFRNPVQSVGASNEVQITDNSGGFDSSVVEQSGLDIIPSTTKITNLGSSTKRFQDLYITTNIDFETNALILKGSGNTKATFGSNGGKDAYFSQWNLHIPDSKHLKIGTPSSTDRVYNDGGTYNTTTQVFDFYNGASWGAI